MMPTGLFLLDKHAYDLIYDDEWCAAIATQVTLPAPPLTRADQAAHAEALARAEIVLGGWGTPRFDAALLERMPQLRLVLYGAGSIRHVVSDAFWARGLRICSAWAANAEPVAQYTLGMILLSLKRAFAYAQRVRVQHTFAQDLPCAGGFRATIGLVSLGMIGRRVCDLLRNFELRIIAYDPLVSAEAARALGVTLCPLEQVFAAADVVSLHTPWLPATEGLITGAHVRAMKPGATLINTARGAVVREAELCEVLRARPDLTAVLDVTQPEPPAADSPLYTLPNVVLTPHIAGSLGPECRRMGRFMVEELQRYLAGQPLLWEISRDRAATVA